MFRRFWWKLLATHLVVVLVALVLVGVHLTQQFEQVYTGQVKVDLLDQARLTATTAAQALASGGLEALRRHLQEPHHGNGRSSSSCAPSGRTGSAPRGQG